ncbi:Adenylate cyclase, class 3 [Rhizobiales bacterium GAS191]|nr:Adenylate cyclase, class 3 [Rhizobiales bacterium GAS191]
MSILEARVPRHLAAIVAADVAGYSRLMGADEEGTFRHLSERRQEMDGLIQQYGGRIANTAGDSVIAEFPSVVAAVECAIAIQKSHAQANLELPANQRIAFRIGIHLGDVMVKDGDLFGDGVNIAARLEQLAEPGGIALTSRVKEEIAGKVAVKTENLGTHDLKNIAKPVGVWRVQLAPDLGWRGHPVARLRRLKSRLLRYVRIFVRRRPAFTVTAVAALVGAAIAAFVIRSNPNAPAIYELRPFTVSADGEAAKQLAGALTNRLIDGLGSVPYVRLLVSNADATKSSSGSAKYSISGSVSPSTTTTRVDAHIVEAVTGHVIMATNFVGPLRPSDEMQDEILGAIGDDLSVGINKLRYNTGAETPDSQRALRLAEEARTRIDLRAEPARAVALFEDATRLSPESLDIAGWYANALAAIASDQPQNSERRNSYLAKAKALLEARKSEVPYHRLLIYAQCQLSNYEGNPEAALAACNQALRISPWSARVYKEIGTAYMQFGQLDRSLAAFMQAERFDHRHSVRAIWEIKAGIATLLLARNREAADWLQRAASVNDQDPWVLGLSAVAFNRLGYQARAASQISALKLLTKEKSTKEAVSNIRDLYNFTDRALNAKLDLVIHEFENLYDLK